MAVSPHIEDRPALPYIALRDKLHRDYLWKVVPSALAEVQTSMERLNITPTGPPLVRYLVADYESGEVEVHIGFSVAIATAPAHLDRLRIGELPAGRYAVVIHQGPSGRLGETMTLLLDWVHRQQLRFQTQQQDNRTLWAGRVERYLVAPPTEPLPANWRTELAILLKD